jgi:hypothetical protein
MIVRTGVPIPAPTGPRRTQFCAEECGKALRAAQRHRGQAIALLSTTIPRRVRSAMPAEAALHINIGDLFGENANEHYVAQWRRFRGLLRGWQRKRHPHQWTYIQSVLEEAKDHAKAARSAAAEAFFWLDDIAADFPPETGFEVASGKVVALREVWDAVHRELHASGALFGGAFGCDLVHADGRYWKECPLAFTHTLSGLSPGFDAEFACNICGGDPSECPHMWGQEYPLIADHPDGECNICGSDACSTHAVGITFNVTAYRNIKSAVMHEVSLVWRPRDPLARNIRTSMSEEDLPVPPPGLDPDKVSYLHDACLWHCPGFKDNRPGRGHARQPEDQEPPPVL